MAELRETPRSNRASQDRYQVHFWIGERDYRLLLSTAQEEGETISQILRRLIRDLRNQPER